MFVSVLFFSFVILFVIDGGNEIYISKLILGRKICNEFKKTYNVQNKKKS